MKRRLSRVIAVIFVIVCAVAFASCSHEHVYGEWSYAVLPTCTEAGVQSRMCTKCEVTEERPAGPLGHDEVKHEAVAATCTEKGNEAYLTCSRCDYTTFKETEALGHDEVKHEAKAPTCTEKGNEEYITCSRCDYTTLVEIPELGHKLSVLKAKAPTCGQSGRTEGSYCMVCKTTMKIPVEIPATGEHTPVEIPGVAPTCTKSGKSAGSECTTCGILLVRCQSLKATGHSIKTVEGKAPTCTEGGVSESRFCESCGYVELAQKELPPLMHKCKQGICIHCGIENYMEPTQYISDYCYGLIGTFENGDRMQELYRRLAEVAREFHNDYSKDLVSAPDRKIASLRSVDFTDLNLTKDEAFTAICAFTMDAPIYYWTSTSSVTGGADYSGNDYATLWVSSFYLKGEVREEDSVQIAETV